MTGEQQTSQTKVYSSIQNQKLFFLFRSYYSLKEIFSDKFFLIFSSLSTKLAMPSYSPLYCLFMFVDLKDMPTWRLGCMCQVSLFNLERCLQVPLFPSVFFLISTGFFTHTHKNPQLFPKAKSNSWLFCSTLEQGRCPGSINLKSSWNIYSEILAPIQTFVSGERGVETLERK